MELSHLGLKLGGFNNEVTALQSDHCNNILQFHYITKQILIIFRS